jgi:hypothetical protein
MSSRPWVRIPPAPSNDWPADGRAKERNSWLRSPQTATSLPPVAQLADEKRRSRLPLSRGRSSAAQSARLSGERSPVRSRSSPLPGGRGVDGSTRGCEPRRRRFEPGRPPLTRADAEQRRAQQAVTLSPRAVVVRLHPSAPRLFDQGDVAQPDERLACNEEDVGSTPTVSIFASVVSTASTRPLYGRGVGSNPSGGSCSCADVAQTEEHRGATPGRPVRSGSSALEGLWCKRKHGELQPRWSGFDPWQACSIHREETR